MPQKMREAPDKTAARAHIHLNPRTDPPSQGDLCRTLTTFRPGGAAAVDPAPPHAPWAPRGVVALRRGSPLLPPGWALGI